MRSKRSKSSNSLLKRELGTSDPSDSAQASLPKVYLNQRLDDGEPRLQSPSSSGSLRGRYDEEAATQAPIDDSLCQ